MSIGKNIIDHDEAEYTLARRCSVPASGDLSKIAANIIAYNMTTTIRHSSIHEGTKITVHDQVRKLSSLSAISVNCNMLIEAKNSNSIPLPFFIDHTQTDIDNRDTNKSGMKVNVHVCRLDSNLSQTNISNISSNNCKDNDMSIDLKCT